jgi:hypothetical protein
MDSAPGFRFEWGCSCDGLDEGVGLGDCAEDAALHFDHF